MPIDDITFPFGVVQWIVTIAIGIYAWVVGRQSATGKDIQALNNRLVAIETQLKHTPTQLEMQSVARQLERIDAHIQAQQEALKPINKSLDRINDFLLNQK